jgi:hypothetical protein
MMERQMSTTPIPLQARLRQFVQDSGGQWDHGAWERLLHALHGEGYETADVAGIGRELERQRVVVVLESARIKGLGPKRVAALAERYGTLPALAAADEACISATLEKNRPLARSIRQWLL